MEYQEAHLKGTVNIQLSDLSSRMGELDRNSAILVCCRTGRRSAQACSALAERGFTKVYNMEEDVAAWIDSGYPVVTGKYAFLDIQVHNWICCYATLEILS